MTILILLLRVYSVGEVSVLARQDSEEALEHWKQRLHEVSTRRCAHITHTLHWIGVEVCDPPKYDGLTDIDFL
jgi:hypothetical protein